MANVLEIWGMRDTVLIGPGMASKVRGWFNSFADMAKVNEIPFFNVRNRSVAGVQYNNQDSAEITAFPFWAMSLGVEFFSFAIGDSCAAPPIVPPIGLGEPKAPELMAPDYGLGEPKAPELRAPDYVNELQIQNAAERAVFAMLMDHAAIKFKLAQDIKLTNVVTHQPAGFGCCGNARALGSGLNSLGVLQNYTNGEPTIENRYKFESEIEMPRGVNFNVNLYFSEYARFVLATMGGPETWFPTITIDGEVPVPAQNSISGIAMTLLGVRGAQQRGELHV
jgi:hypothetical protein